MIASCDRNTMTSLLPLVLFLLFTFDHFQDTRSYYHNIQPWRLARGGRSGKFLRKFDVVEDEIFVPSYNIIKQQRSASQILAEETPEKKYTDDISDVLFVEDLENQLQNKFHEGGFYQRQFAEQIRDFPILESETPIQQTLWRISERVQEMLSNLP